MKRTIINTILAVTSLFALLVVFSESDSITAFVLSHAAAFGWLYAAAKISKHTAPGLWDGNEENNI